MYMCSFTGCMCRHVYCILCQGFVYQFVRKYVYEKWSTRDLLKVYHRNKVLFWKISVNEIH